MNFCRSWCIAPRGIGNRTTHFRFFVEAAPADRKKRGENINGFDHVCLYKAQQCTLLKCSIMRVIVVGKLVFQTIRVYITLSISERLTFTKCIL